MLPKRYAGDERHDWCQGLVAVELELMQFVSFGLPLRLGDSEEPMLLLAKDALPRGLLLVEPLLLLLMLVATVVVLAVALLLMLPLLLLLLVVAAGEPGSLSI